MTKKKKKTVRKKGHNKKAARKRQLLQQKIGLAAIGMLVVLMLFICIGNRKEYEKDADPVINEIKEEEMTEQTEKQEKAEVEAADQSAVETEEMIVAAEVADPNDEEDQQAMESQQEPAIEADTILEDNDFEQSGVSLGIDAAKWQGTIDWHKVKEAGVDFAIIRVGYRTMKTGVIYEDPCAKYNLQQAQAAGIKLGAYFFSTAVSEEEAKEEAAWVSGFVAQYPMTYPIAYNCEGFHSPESRQYHLTQAERTRLAVSFMDYISARGYTPMFYASKNEMEGSALWDMDKMEGKYKIWVSQYTDKPYPETEKSSYTGTYDMWQYTNQGLVPGVPYGADLNVAYFGYSEIAQPKDSTPPEVVEADPEALIRFTEVDETVTAKIETNLRSVPSTTDDNTIVTKLKNGDTAQRTGIGHNGWSRVIYNGQKLYAVSNYLTTDIEAEQPSEDSATETKESEKKQEDNHDGYTTVNEPVTAKSNTNLRSSADSSNPDNIVGTLQYGEVAIRTGVSDSGWSQLSYNGQIVYAVSSYLTTDGNYKENNTPSLQNPEAGIVFTQVNEQVTAKIETNLRNLPTTLEPSSVVASLKNGETAVRTGVGSNGWSRLNYNGQTVYAVSSYLVLIEQ